MKEDIGKVGELKDSVQIKQDAQTTEYQSNVCIKKHKIHICNYLFFSLNTKKRAKQ